MTPDPRSLVESSIGLLQGAKNVERARMHGSEAHLAGWEHLTMRQAAATITRLTEEVEGLKGALSDIIGHFGDREQAPGHSHNIPGIWDRDIGNGEKGGTPCEWCAKWSDARATLARSSDGE